MAMTMRSRRLPAVLLAPPAAATWLLAKVPPLRQLLFRLMGSVISVDSVTLKATLEDWHDYRLDWGFEAVEFHVDNQLALRSKTVPRAPLGLVLWIDNQYLCASPKAGLRFGTIRTREEQWLELDQLSVE